MRRQRIRLAAVATAALLPLAAAGAASAASGPVSAPFGPFGFTTVGLGDDGNGGGVSYGEPSLAIAPDGTHYAASTPGCGGVCYWYSSDAGATWAPTLSSGGGGDSELDFLPDGTLLSADLDILGPNSVMYRSLDYGQTWIDKTTAGSEQDRQWLAHSPDSSVDGGTQYLVYHDLVAEAELAAVSKDGGKTWTKGPLDGDLVINSASQAGGVPAAAGCTPGATAGYPDQGVNTFSGPMLVGPDGTDLYVLYSISDLQSNLDASNSVPPFGPTRAIVAAHSSDAGATWTNTYAICSDLAVPTSEETVNGAIFPWGFVDDAGTVYVVFNSNRGAEGSEHLHQDYIYSTDSGATFSEPVQLDGLGLDTGSALYATGDAVSPGVIDVAWYQNDTGVPSDSDGVWVPHFAQVTGADTDSPVITEQAVTGIPNHTGGICLQGILCGVGPGSADRSLADFFELDVNPVTKLAVIAYADNGGGRDKNQVVVARQTVQPLVVEAVVPEVPLAALAPLAAAALLGVALLRRRRRV